MVGCVLSQLKPSEFSILSCVKGLGLRPGTFFTAKNGELLGLYHIRRMCRSELSPSPKFTASHDNYRCVL